MATSGIIKSTHACGDEPTVDLVAKDYAEIHPMNVGMNRGTSWWAMTLTLSTHAWWD